jgi:hypothetical protein
MTQRWLHWLICACLGAAMAACQPLTPQPLTPPPVTELPFETVALNEWGGVFEMGDEPQLMLLTTADDLTKVKDLMSEEDFANLQQVDFQDYFVVALFRGWRPSSNYQTVIERITRRNDTLTVEAQFWEPGAVASEGETSPYHVVKIARDDLEPAQLELALNTYTITPTPPAD